MKVLFIIILIHCVDYYHDISSYVAAATFVPQSGPIMRVKGSAWISTGRTGFSTSFQERSHFQAHKRLASLTMEAHRKRISVGDIIRCIHRKRRRAYILSKRYTSLIPRGGGGEHSTKKKRGSCNSNSLHSKSKNMRMYVACLFVVLAWISTGTIFYSKFNNWPIPQSFFYAVDAGMSIGFCTDVAEKRIGSRAFTIVFILLGASCVGGALALFIKDIMEGVADQRHDKFEQLLAAHAVKRIDNENKGQLDYPQFQKLVQEWTNKTISDDAFEKLCEKFDGSRTGKIPSELFVRNCLEMDTLLHTAGPLYSENFLVRTTAYIWNFLKKSFSGTHRIFTVFVIWICTGIWWGNKRQGWDIITATHFAVSALATGGLTAPSVNADGILPTEAALFCGVYCLFGIPLFALTLGHYARVLVEGYVSAVEERAVLENIRHPLDFAEFEYAKNLCSSDKYMHLSDFIVLQLLRQGKVDMKVVNLIKSQYELLDTKCSGRVSSDEACRMCKEEEID